MVMAVLDKSFDVYVLSLGVVKRVYCEVRRQVRGAGVGVGGVIDAVLGMHPWFGGGGLGGRGEGLKRAALRCGREGREEEIHNMKVT